MAILRREPGGDPVRAGRSGPTAPDSTAPVSGSTTAGSTAPTIIALVGIDGSGKTTQARRLADALTAAGTPATYWQNAGGRRWFGRLARRLGRRDGQRLLGRRGLLLAESVLRWLAIARALFRSRLWGRVAVMDRYAVCQYASIRAHGRRGLGDRGPGERLARLAYRVFPRPDITFLLSVEPGEAYRRIEARGTDHEDIRYLAAAQGAYRALPEHPAFVVIDASRPLDEVTEAIFARLPVLAPGALAGLPPAPSGPAEVDEADTADTIPARGGSGAARTGP